MKRILVFGNSGSGKSTLAQKLSARYRLAHLDLDTLAWEPTSPPTRRTVQSSWQQIGKFIAANPGWVIEGCYADLLELAIHQANEIYFLNLPIQACIQNARVRPWEPHKYASRAEQDANLPMLLEWISQYVERDDTFSEAAHRRLSEGFSGAKYLFTSNAEAT